MDLSHNCRFCYKNTGLHQRRGFQSGWCNRSHTWECWQRELFLFSSHPLAPFELVLGQLKTKVRDQCYIDNTGHMTEHVRMLKCSVCSLHCCVL